MELKPLNECLKDVVIFSYIMCKIILTNIIILIVTVLFLPIILAIIYLIRNVIPDYNKILELVSNQCRKLCEYQRKINTDLWN